MFWKRVFSESETEPSFSRVASGFMTIMTAVWVTRIVWTTGSIPDLTGPAILICSLYAINKASDIVDAARGRN